MLETSSAHRNVSSAGRATATTASQDEIQREARMARLSLCGAWRQVACCAFMHEQHVSFVADQHMIYASPVTDLRGLKVPAGRGAAGPGARGHMGGQRLPARHRQQRRDRHRAGAHNPGPAVYRVSTDAGVRSPAISCSCPAMQFAFAVKCSVSPVHPAHVGICRHLPTCELFFTFELESLLAQIRIIPW